MGVQPLFALLNGTAQVGLLLSVCMYVCVLSALVWLNVVVCVQAYNVVYSILPISPYNAFHHIVFHNGNPPTRRARIYWRRRKLTILINLCLNEGEHRGKDVDRRDAEVGVWEENEKERRKVKEEKYRTKKDKDIREDIKMQKEEATKQTKKCILTSLLQL